MKVLPISCTKPTLFCGKETKQDAASATPPTPIMPQTNIVAPAPAPKADGKVVAPQNTQSPAQQAPQLPAQPAADTVQISGQQAPKKCEGGNCK